MTAQILIPSFLAYKESGQGLFIKYGGSGASERVMGSGNYSAFLDGKLVPLSFRDNDQGLVALVSAGVTVYLRTVIDNDHKLVGDLPQEGFEWDGKRIYHSDINLLEGLVKILSV